MTFLEVMVIVLAASFVLTLLGRYIYKRIKHLPTGECACCKLRNAGKGIKEYYNEHANKCNCK